PSNFLGKLEDKEELTTNNRSKHEFSRTANFENIIKNFDSPRKHPKCKLSLTNRLAQESNLGHASSRSSLYSIPSIEWDGRCKSDYGLRTRSLTRQRTHGKLFRTRSHSGFINSYLKDPEPNHFHLPRCNSCGAANVSYAWELSKAKNTKNSLYYSVDNLPQKCSEDVEKQTVVEKVVPVFKIDKKEEFVESQEFNEDYYIGEIGNSFSSENQTVIEKNEATVVCNTENKDMFVEDLAVNDDINKTIESVEGEYHSFTDLEDSYESPVKDLVEKDIRDYSVPIDFYCDDFKVKDDKRSPLKVKNLLEPILEESKSSYGDDCNTSTIEKTEFANSNIDIDEIEADSNEMVENTDISDKNTVINEHIIRVDDHITDELKVEDHLIDTSIKIDSVETQLKVQDGNIVNKLIENVPFDAEIQENNNNINEFEDERLKMIEFKTQDGNKYLEIDTKGHKLIENDTTHIEISKTELHMIRQSFTN
ncbi:uncharacterized protein LOC142984964, partial [Anticarsia gemmatalis]|uniref:uncharacterized protein LOC142984964 n=1 Tax=Anticarsia gemmatalis TaxID=129554 RepID=UPI003F777089